MNIFVVDEAVCSILKDRNSRDWYIYLEDSCIQIDENNLQNLRDILNKIKFEETEWDKQYIFR